MRSASEITPGNFVYFWSDKLRWLGPARSVSINGNTATLIHDEQIKTSSLSRLRKTESPIDHIESPIDEDIQNLTRSDENDADEPTTENGDK